jgi:hypothetical protein
MDLGGLQILPTHRLTFSDGGDSGKGGPEGCFHSGLRENRGDLALSLERTWTCKGGHALTHLPTERPMSLRGPSREEGGC